MATRKKESRAIEVYYGTTQTGTKIHFGTEVLHAESGSKEWRIVSKCGNSIVSHSPDEPFPGKVNEFCKTCYRMIAWEHYVEYCLGRAREIEGVASGAA